MAEVNLAPYAPAFAAAEQRKAMQAAAQQPFPEFSYNGIKSTEGATENTLAKMLQGFMAGYGRQAPGMPGMPGQQGAGVPGMQAPAMPPAPIPGMGS